MGIEWLTVNESCDIDEHNEDLSEMVGMESIDDVVSGTT